MFFFKAIIYLLIIFQSAGVYEINYTNTEVADLALVVDFTFLVSSYPPNKNDSAKMNKQFQKLLKSLAAQNLDIDSQKFRVAILDAANDFEVLVSLENGTNFEALQVARLGKVSKDHDSIPKYFKVLNNCNTSVFRESHGDRLSVPNLIIVLFPFFDLALDDVTDIDFLFLDNFLETDRQIDQFATKIMSEIRNRLSMCPLIGYGSRCYYDQDFNCVSDFQIVEPHPDVNATVEKLCLRQELNKILPCPSENIDQCQLHCDRLDDDELFWSDCDKSCGRGFRKRIESVSTTKFDRFCRKSCFDAYCGGSGFKTKKRWYRQIVSNFLAVWSIGYLVFLVTISLAAITGIIISIVWKCRQKGEPIGRRWTKSIFSTGWKTKKKKKKKESTVSKIESSTHYFETRLQKPISDKKTDEKKIEKPIPDAPTTSTKKIRNATSKEPKKSIVRRRKSADKSRSRSRSDTGTGSETASSEFEDESSIGSIDHFEKKPIKKKEKVKKGYGKSIDQAKKKSIAIREKGKIKNGYRKPIDRKKAKKSIDRHEITSSESESDSVESRAIERKRRRILNENQAKKITSIDSITA